METSAENDAGEQPSKLHAATATEYTVFAVRPETEAWEITGETARDPFTYTWYEEML